MDSVVMREMITLLEHHLVDYRSAMKHALSGEYVVGGAGLRSLDQNRPLVPQVFRLLCTDTGLDEKESDYVNSCVEDLRKSFLLPMSDYYFRPNETQQMWAEFYRTNIVALDQESDSFVNPELQTWGMYDRPLHMYLEENALGKLMYDLSAANLATPELFCGFEERQDRLMDFLRAETR